MKRLFSLLFASLLLSVSAFAESCGCCFEIAGEWLYMIATIDQPYYAVEQGTGATLFNGKRVGNTQKWHSGGRIEATYYLPCCDYIRGRWTGFNKIQQNDSTTVPNFTILTHPAAASLNTDADISHRFSFNYVDLFYGRTVYHCTPVFITIEAGFQYANIHWRENITYGVLNVGSVSRLRNRSHMWGIGPEFGLRFDYRFCGCFSLVSRTTTALLISKKEADFFDNEGLTAPLDLAITENDEYWMATPTIDTRLGLNYMTQFNWWCLHGCFEVEVGYEFIHVHKGVDRIYFVDNTAEAQSFTELMDFTLHGPYVRLGFCF